MATWRMLLNGSTGFPGRSTKVVAEPEQGFRWLKKAATAGHRQAQVELAQCFASGTVVKKSYPEAYKWFGIAANGGDILAKGYRDQMVLKMSPTEIADGERRLASFVVGVKPSAWDFIEVKGISGAPARRLAIVNASTVSAGEKFSLTVDHEMVSVVCLKIGERSVVLQIGNESRELNLQTKPL